MLHNDTLRRLRFALKLNDKKLRAIFALVNVDMSLQEVSRILKKEGEDDYLACRDRTMCSFLDGLIIHYRGKQEGREPVPLPAKAMLSNNEILRKLRIALEMKDQDMIAVLALANLRVSKSELSALFRKPDHRNYKPCGDQFLRNFITGLTKKYRPDAENSE